MIDNYMMQELIRLSVMVTADAVMEYFEQHTCITNKDGHVIPDAQIDVIEGQGAAFLKELIWKRLAEKGIEFKDV